MSRNQYTIPLNHYFKIENIFGVSLGYQEGTDQLRLAIKGGRDRVIRDIDGEYLYLIVRKEKAPEEILDEESDVFVDYIKCNVKKIENEYVINLEELLTELNLTFTELDDKEFDEVLKHEREYPTDELYPYGKMENTSFWLDDEVFSISVYYLKDAFVIGDVSIRYVQRDTLLEEDACNKEIQESVFQKTVMQLEEFKKFVQTTDGLVYLALEWETGYISRESMEDEPKWIYKACFDVDGEKKKVSVRIDDGKNYTASFLYHFMQCKTYEEFVKLKNKKNLLGV